MVASALVYILVTGVFIAPLFAMAPPGSSIRQLLRTMFGSLYGPEVWGPGLLLGFIVNRKMFDRFPFWVWVIGIAWLAYGVWEGCSLAHYSQSYPRRGTFLQ